VSAPQTPRNTPVDGSRGSIDVAPRDLQGLSSREAQRRLVAYGANELLRRGGRRWPRQLALQFTHPLALLLWLAAALAFGAGLRVVGVAILAVIVLNALFAFFQEQQAEKAVEALRCYLEGAGNPICGSHAAALYSWMRPPSTSRRRTWSRAAPVAGLGGGSSIGGRWSKERWGRCSLA
jgi:Cation transporter/ATPase, N-terminus